MLILLNLLKNIYRSNPNKRGFFIVIDGNDGSGKKTQIDLLNERLLKAGYKTYLADFPQYGKKSAGMVEEYLNGRYGLADDVGPYKASIFYACDRYDASFEIKEKLNQGIIVLSNRYVTANMAHQGGKISDPLERKVFFSWLKSLEYDLFGLPKPDLNIILHIKAEIAQGMVDKKTERKYLAGKKRDIHENELSHLKNAEKIYLEMPLIQPNCVLLECSPNEKVLSRQIINNMIWDEVTKIINNRQLLSQNIIDKNQLNNKTLLKQKEKYLKNDNLPENNFASLSLTEYITLFPNETQNIYADTDKGLQEKNILELQPNFLSSHLHIEINKILSENKVAIKIKNNSNNIVNLACGQKICDAKIV